MFTSDISQITMINFMLVLLYCYVSFNKLANMVLCFIAILTLLSDKQCYLILAKSWEGNHSPDREH